MTSAQRLAETVALSDERLRPYRRNRRMFLRQYAGPYFAGMLGRGPQGSGPGGAGGLASAGPAEPLNTIYSVVSVVLPHLVATNPRAMIRTPFAELRPTADLFARAWNHLTGEIDLGRSLRTVVTDALFGAGIMKTGLAPTPDLWPGHPRLGASGEGGAAGQGAMPLPVLGEGHVRDSAHALPQTARKGMAPHGPSAGMASSPDQMSDPGRPFAEAVDLDDYLIDPFARRREEAAFEGNRYRVSRRFLLESGLFEAGQVSNLPQAQVENLGHLEDSVELIDLWLPGEGVIVTLPAGEAGAAAGAGRFLREVAWEGPDRGPYEVLGFHWAAGSPLPVPPVGLFYDLHVMINKLARKQARQADRQKDLVLFDDRAAEEAQKLAGAFDGEMVGVQNVDRYRQVSFGGPHDETYAQLSFLFEQFGRIAGNVDLLGGLSPMSDTLGQDQMLHENATVRIEDMRSQVYEFTKHVGTKLAWYVWNDPVGGISDFKSEISNLESAASRRGDWLDYRFDVEPHSMSQDTPTRKYRRVVEWITHVLLPMAPLAAGQGLTLDVERLAQLTGAMLNIEEAAGVFRREAVR